MAAIMKASHAISFHLLNRDRHSAIGIFDGDQDQTSTLEITNSSGRDLKPKKLVGPDPTAENHHFELKFRPGTLKLNGTNPITVDAGEGGWKISKPVETSDDVSLYLLSTTPVALRSGAMASLKLKHLSAEGAGGARGTRVELKWGGNLEYVAADGQSAGELFAGYRVQHLSIVNESGQKNIPLHVGIVGANKILNDGKAANTLKLRITNLLPTGGGNILLNPEGKPIIEPPRSEFVLSFDSSDKEDWALGTKSQVQKINVKAVAGTKEFHVKEPTQAQSPEWIIWPKESVTLAPDDFVEVTLSNIKTSLPSGQTNAYIHYKNIPGYWDGDFVSVIEKAPVVYKDEIVGPDNKVQRVGVGTNDPQATLHVKGKVHAEVLSATAAGKVGTGVPTPADGLHVVGDMLFGRSPSQIKCVNDDHRLIFDVDGFEIREQQKIVFSPGSVGNARTAKTVMLADGNVGIGTPTPEKHLHVSGAGDQEIMIQSTDQNSGVKWSLQSSGTSGRFEIVNRTAPRSCLSILKDGNVGIGTTDPKATLHVKGNVRLEKDKEILFEDNGQIRSADDAHRILFRREGYNVLELREYGHIIFSPGAEQGGETAKMIIKNTGAVGIGTPDPKKTLHVVGGLRVENEVSVGGGFDFDVDAPGVHGGRLKVKQNGLVGIGTHDPTKAKLEVSGQVGTQVNGYGYLNKERASSTTKTESPNFSIWASDRIAAVEFNAYSDERMKNIQGRSNSATDLITLLGIEITDYCYKDVIGKGNGTYKKVIGQQIEKVFPQAASRVTDVVPDIYQQAAMRDGWVALATDLKKGERVKLITGEGEGVHEVLEVMPDKFRLDFKHEEDQVFVFGREVNDFVTVDYDAIAVLNVSATQQLKKEMDQEVKALRVENAEFRVANDALEKRLQLLESKLEAVLGVRSATNGSNGNGRH